MGLEVRGGGLPVRSQAWLATMPTPFGKYLRARRVEASLSLRALASIGQRQKTNQASKFSSIALGAAVGGVASMSGLLAHANMGA